MQYTFCCNMVTCSNSFYVILYLLHLVILFLSIWLYSFYLCHATTLSKCQWLLMCVSIGCYYYCQSVNREFLFYIFYNYFVFIFNETGNNIHSEPQSKRKHTLLNNYQRQAISEVLVNLSYGRKINKGVVKRLSSSYQVSVDVIYSIWRQTNETGDVRHKKTTNCGRK